MPLTSPLPTRAATPSARPVWQIPATVPHLLGRVAFFGGQLHFDNPFTPGSDESQQWAQGWLEAMAEEGDE